MIRSVIFTTLLIATSCSRTVTPPSVAASASTPIPKIRVASVEERRSRSVANARDALSRRHGRDLPPDVREAIISAYTIGYNEGARDIAAFASETLSH